MVSIKEQKKALRKELKKAVKLISPEDKEKKSTIIINKLINDPLFKRARNIMLYASTPDEPDTWELINNYSKYHKNFYLPAVYRMRAGKIEDKNKLTLSKLGIYEPESTEALNSRFKPDIVIVPALGTDKFLNRLGHGSGWYDRALKIIKPSKIICLCFKEQIIEQIPNKTFDVKIDQLITD